MRSNSSISLVWLFIGLCFSIKSFANNITVSAISLTNRNTSAQTVRVNFNLTWDNSWRTTSAPFNWDAAWVFVKYKVGTNGTWKHATLATSGHTIPSGTASTQSDATGLFLYRSAAGSGTFSPSGIQFVWNYGTDGVANDAKIIVRVFAIEMVYNPPGGFQAGSGAINNGELRRANDVTASAPASTFTVTGSLPTFQSNNSSSSANNIAAYNNTASDLTGTTTASLNAGYPTGFDAFYSMKYEISQQQYTDFLNTLTYTQQAARTITAPSSAAGTPALSSGNANRNGIDIQVYGTATNFPAVYACNLNGNGVFNEADDGQHIACNFLSWDDLTAYLDWAGLRPMTELEYEKSCRGNQTPVAGEYPWGSTSATALSGLTNAGLTSEIASNSSSNIAFTNAFATGPVRNGIFATATNSRSTSGAGYYGNMELGGNLWERVVTIGTSDGRTFSATHGNGTLTSSGAADVTGWPAATGSGWKGGAYDTAAVAANSSGRTQAANGNNNRVANAGGRGVRTIPSGIVTDGLVLWLDAGITPSYPGSGTTWTDLSGNNNHGTLTNGPTFNSSNGGSFVFDGVDDNVTFTSNPQFANQISVQVWINQTAISGSNIWIIGQELSFRLLYDNSNKFHFAIATSNATWYSAGTLVKASGNTGVWNHVVATYDGSNLRIYINGNLIATSSVAISGNLVSSAYNFNLMKAENGLTNGKGTIGSVGIYNRTLTSSEVAQNFNAQKARFGL